jgi:NAD(P)H dehydrogenase (quinone)
VRILLVYAHPVPESFNAAVRDRAVASLEAAGHEVRVADLNAEGFDPVMRPDERRAYHDAGVNEAPILAELERLRWAEGLIFVYPTWWYGPPAILKGWIDRVWVPHATFTMPEKGKPIGRVMTNIRLLGAISTLGSPWWWWRLMGEPGRRILLRGFRPLISPTATTFWLALHEMDSASHARREAFLAKVDRRLGRLR